jgi:hypothetical protein
LPDGAFCLPWNVELGKSINDGLVLQRVTTDGTVEEDQLSVYRISQLRLKHAHIAYLSDWLTAENKVRLLRDEVIHIVSGFQVAGFSHVVGSLWPAGDAECVQVVSLFYSYLFDQSGVSHPEARALACALQEAVKAIHADDMDMPLNWAQFVHFGAWVDMDTILLQSLIIGVVHVSNVSGINQLYPSSWVMLYLPARPNFRKLSAFPISDCRLCHIDLRCLSRLGISSFNSECRPRIRELVLADAIECVDQQDANGKEIATMEEQTIPL